LTPAFLVAVALTIAAATPATARQDPTVIQSVAEQYAREQTAGLPGAVRITVQPFDANNGLEPCSVLSAFLPEGARLWGRGSVGVRCDAAPAWRVFVPVRVEVEGQYLIVARPVAPGRVLTGEDLGLREGDLTQFPADLLTDPEQAVGRSARVGLSAGRPLRAAMIRAPLAVRQGQTVKVVARGTGFLASTEGRALNPAVAGEVAQVRTSAGATLSGIARTGGVVEIRFY
jgi:flagella basal body P-ring formation protein FlgA